MGGWIDGEYSKEQLQTSVSRKQRNVSRQNRSASRKHKSVSRHKRSVSRKQTIVPRKKSGTGLSRNQGHALLSSQYADVKSNVRRKSVSVRTLSSTSAEKQSVCGR